MDGSAPTPQKAGVSDYLAAERTLLAWIRTGLAMMGFGFVVARFGLFLQQIQTMQTSSSEQPYGLSLWFGTALIVVGVIVNVFADGTIFDWSEHSIAAKYHPLALRSRLSQLLSFWHWSVWQWPSTSFRSAVPLIQNSATRRHL